MQLDYIRFMLMGFTAACYVLDPTNTKKSGISSVNFKKFFFFPPQLPSYNRRYISSQDFHLLYTYNCYNKCVNVTSLTLPTLSFC